MDLKSVPAWELENELRRRESEFQNWSEAAVTALEACIVAIQVPPGDTISARQREKASQLITELAYRCLPGGNDYRIVGSDKGEVRERTGMFAGWGATCSDRDEILKALDPHYEERKALEIVDGVLCRP